MSAEDFRINIHWFRVQHPSRSYAQSGELACLNVPWHVSIVTILSILHTRTTTSRAQQYVALRYRRFRNSGPRIQTVLSLLPSIFLLSLY